MRLRSATKRIAAIAAERPSTVASAVEVIIHQESRLLDLPAELRCFILSYAMELENEPAVLVGDIYRYSTAIIDPPVTFVCRQLRADALPLFYSQKAFFFNLSRNQYFYKDLKQWVAKTTPSKIQLMRKAMFFGRSQGGQIGITIDFAKLKIIDARWWRIQNSLGRRRPDLSHHHMRVRHCEKLQTALDAALHSDETLQWPCAYQAMRNILKACPRCFWIPKSNRTYSFAGATCRLGEQSFGPCDCSQIVGVVA
jgi:hypothetical protein